MAIKIDAKRCIGCRLCVDVCPGNLISVDKKCKAEIYDPRECWDCTACMKECPVQAIEMYLFPETGGSGSTLFVKEEKNIMKWQIKENGVVVEEIEVNKKDSNKF
ncbi:ferredoxin family protein [Ilyobacter sp.]|uniref:4Fe-4S dicluster domain-containing protein n=1 Tax=Ilyobacter sp. TaxID=3100343 RepID=UPI0035624460